LSGEVDHQHVVELEVLFSMGLGPIVLDLANVTLVNQGAVSFLVRAESRGIQIVNCPDYVRSWMANESGPRTEAER
jgi:hypothetical protein